MTHRKILFGWFFVSVWWMILGVAVTPVAAEEDAESGPNILFIVIDTLRADHLTAYGYSRETSPNIDALARDGVRFEHARSQASWTKPSMAALWSAAYPTATGVQHFSHAIPESAIMPAEILQSAGYRTAGIWRNGWLAPQFGFAQGFDLYFRPPATGAFARRGGRSSMPTDFDSTRSAQSFMRTHRNQPFFLYVHYMDVHQYVYDESSALFGTRYVDAYDNAIHWVDSNVGELIDELERLELRGETLIVLAADHGEEFSDHGSEGHGRTLHAEVTHTPLIFSQPGRLREGVSISQRVENIDIWPTILELVGQQPLPATQGTSLAAFIRYGDKKGSDSARVEAAPGDAATFSQLDRSWGRRSGPTDLLVSVTHDGWRLIRAIGSPDAHALFRLIDDPHEQLDRAKEEPDRVLELQRKIDAMLDQPLIWRESKDVVIDAERLEELRALGYHGVAREHER